MAAISVMAMIVLLMLAMLGWSGVHSQSTVEEDDSGCSSGDSPSVLQSLSQLAKRQLAAAKKLDDVARDLKLVKTNVQRLQKLPTSPTSNSCTYHYYSCSFVINLFLLLLYFLPLYLVVVCYAKFAFFLFKGSSKCGFPPCCPI